MRRKAVYNKATALGQWVSRPLTFAVVMASMMLPIAGVHAGQNLIVNGSFELDTFSGTWKKDIAVTGWTLSPRAHSGLTQTGAPWCGSTLPVGKYALLLESMSGSGITATQTFTVPRPGSYRLSLSCEGRPGSWNGQQLYGGTTSISLIHDGVTNTLGSVTGPEGVFTRFVKNVEIAEAGDYTLLLESPPSPTPSAGYNDSSRANIFDNIVFAQNDDGNAIVNGSFDEGVVTDRSGSWSYANHSGYRNPAWIVSKTDQGGLSKANGTWVKSGLPVGRYALYLQTGPGIGYTDVSASQTFAIDEAGVYRLSFSYMGRPGSHENTTIPYAGSTTEVKVLNGDVPLLEEEISTVASKTAIRRFSRTLQFPVAGFYTLVFHSPATETHKANAIDNVVVERVGGDNLIVNGSFEAGDVSGNWSYANANVFSEPVWTLTPSNRTGLAMADGTWVSVGHDICNYALFLQSHSEDTATKPTASASQTVSVPSSGVYRLSFNYSGRPWHCNGRSEVVLQRGDASVLSLANFVTEDPVFRSFDALVSVGDPGDMTFKIDIPWVTDHYACAFDAVRLRPFNADDFSFLRSGALTFDQVSVDTNQVLVLPPHTKPKAVWLDEGATLRMTLSDDVSLVVADTVTFANNSKIVFDISSLTVDSAFFAVDTFALPGGASDVLDFVEVTGSTEYVTRLDNNVISISKVRVPSTAVWTGAGDRSRLGDTNNWMCSDNDGVIVGVLPGPATSVLIDGDTTFSIPEGASLLPWRNIRFGSSTGRVTLLDNCDWRPLGAVDIASGTMIDVSNRVLKVSTLAGNYTVTSSATNSTELVTNGSFETVTGSFNSNYKKVTSSFYPNGWNWDSYDSGDCGAGLEKGGKVWYSGTRIAGNNICYLQANCRIWQTVNVPEDGTYALSFLYSARPQYGESVIRVEIDGVCEGRVFCQTETQFKPAQVVIPLTAGEHVLALRNEQFRLKQTNYYCANVDAVSLRRVAVGELHVDVAEGTTVANSSVSLTGALRLVKTGAGTLIPSKAQQSYFGGTEVREGVVKFGELGNSGHFGNLFSEVEVKDVLDMNGKYIVLNMVVLNGGTMRNSVAINNVGQVAALTGMRLKADSRIELANAYSFIAPGWARTFLDLAGHTLTIENQGAPFYAADVEVTAGNIVCSGIFQFTFKEAGHEKYCDFSSVGMTFGAKGHLRVDSFAERALLGDYTSKATTADNFATDTGTLKVYGMFRPETGYFRACELQGGSTIDLTGYAGAVPLAGVEVSDAASPSTLTVELNPDSTTTRTWAKEKQYLLTWESIPSNITFELDAASRDVFKLKANVSGLWLYKPSGTVIIVK